MSNQGRTSRSGWWIFGIALVACWIVADRLAGAPAEAVSTDSLPREVLAVRRAENSSVWWCLAMRMWPRNRLAVGNCSSWDCVIHAFRIGLESA